MYIHIYIHTHTLGLSLFFNFYIYIIKYVEYYNCEEDNDEYFIIDLLENAAITFNIIQAGESGEIW